MRVPRALDDDLVMSLVESALDRPPDQRESYIRDACSGDPDLFAQVRDYVDWEDRMQGFLLEPVLATVMPECRLEPGELLENRFRIVREVAQGGMGIVYEAVDEKLRKRIALKCAKNGFQQRLSPEVRHASEISHPNVCRIFEIHTSSSSRGEIDFFTMEFLDGETLTARLKRGRLPENEARAIGMQICQGLAEAHRNRVVHGDLKSNNVILTRSADGSVRAVITDFGLALGPPAPLEESAPAGSGSSEAGGTPAYMAPELWTGVKPTAASDVYALGVILYELATGRLPFAEPSRHVGADRKMLPAHSKWDWVLARCLDPDPAKRFPGAVQVARALEPSRTWRWWLAVAATAAALAAGVWTIASERAAAPQESVRLAMLPLDASPEASGPAATVSQDAARELVHLKGSKRVRVSVVPPAEVTRHHVDSASKAQSVFGATHVLQGRLARQNGGFVIHALVTDVRTQANKDKRDFTYAPEELRYAPLALAGMATAALLLPPLEVRPVNATAKQDYSDGLAYTRQDSTIDQALHSLKRAVDADIDSPLTWAALAEAQYFKYHATENKAWLESAWESLAQAQRRDSDLAPVHRVSGLRLFNAGSYQSAEAEYNRSIELGSGRANAQTYWRLGQVLERTKHPEQALVVFKKAVELDPLWFKTYLQLGAFYSSQGETKQAVQEYKTAVSIAPNEPETHYNLGTAYVEQGRWEEAEHELREAIVPGGPVWASNNLGVALIREGKDPEAIPFLRDSSVNSYRRWMNLGDAYRRTKQRRDSLRSYKTGLDLAGREMDRHPQDGSVRSYFAYLSARLDDRRRAESEIVQALNLSPGDKDTFEIAAWTYVALGEFDQAVDILEKLPDQALGDAVRSPNLAELQNYPRFIELLSSRHIQ
jgi:tetratricopeptide (TPR) repeat protein